MTGASIFAVSVSIRLGQSSAGIRDGTSRSAAVAPTKRSIAFTRKAPFTKDASCFSRPAKIKRKLACPFGVSSRPGVFGVGSGTAVSHGLPEEKKPYQRKDRDQNWN